MQAYFTKRAQFYQANQTRKRLGETRKGITECRTDAKRRRGEGRGRKILLFTPSPRLYAFLLSAVPRQIGAKATRSNLHDPQLKPVTRENMRNACTVSNINISPPLGDKNRTNFNNNQASEHTI